MFEWLNNVDIIGYATMFIIVGLVFLLGRSSGYNKFFKQSQPQHAMSPLCMYCGWHRAHWSKQPCKREPENDE